MEAKPPPGHRQKRRHSAHQESGSGALSELERIPPPERAETDLLMVWRRKLTVAMDALRETYSAQRLDGT